MSDRFPDYLEHIFQAASDARSFVGGMRKEQFFADRRSRQAVTMSLLIIGEAAAKMLERHADFVESHPEIPWRSMRGMRNRIVHGISILTWIWSGKPCKQPCLICCNVCQISAVRQKRRTPRVRIPQCSHHSLKIPFGQIACTPTFPSTSCVMSTSTATLVSM